MNGNTAYGIFNQKYYTMGGKQQKKTGLPFIQTMGLPR
jgi:hypothetical protein